MLFLLTGDVQIGKTRWLEQLCDDLSARGVLVAGVLAPGVWQPCASDVKRREADGVNRCAFADSGQHDVSEQGALEKLGIDNVLLPKGERIAFARRRDLALAEGLFDARSQSESAQLVWHISDEALARVNAHFAMLSSADCFVGAHASLLVVDEVGRLELECGGGLTEAMALLQAGPTERFSHALVVVRNTLLERAYSQFAPVWRDCAVIVPGDTDREAVLARVVTSHSI